MSARVRAVPDTPDRAIGLIRVSKERDGMVSPEVQRAAISDYATSRGYQIVGWLEGLDESGSRARSAWWPRLEQAVDQVEAGGADVVLVWKFSRTARHRLKWAVALDRVETAGGRMESATEQVDVTTSTGRFTRGMLAELNAFEAERIGEVWREVHARRIRAGRPATGKPRYGYTYDLEHKLHKPDPVTGPILTQLYNRYVAGESVYALVRWLNSHGHATTAGGLWSDRSLRRVMDSGFAAGKFTAGGVLYDGVHEPLIPAKLWQAYLDARVRRRQAGPRRERSQYLLSGLVRCARCGHAMVAGQFGHERQPKYRCKTGKEKGLAACAGGYVTAKFVEAAVYDWLQDLAADADHAHEAALLTKARRVGAQTDATRLRRAVAKAEAALSRLAVQDAQTPLPASVYAQAHRDLTTQLDGLQTALEDAERTVRGTGLNPGRVARGILARWDTAPVAHRRTELATLLDHVAVTTGRPHATFDLVPTWETSL